MKTKARESRACEPLVSVRKYRDPNGLTPSERVLLDALVEHGSVSKVARALGFGISSTSARMQAIREKIGAATSADAIALWLARRDAA
jgi:DNA-binding CsgD family transcriptional regulator